MMQFRMRGTSETELTRSRQAIKSLIALNPQSVLPLLTLKTIPDFPRYRSIVFGIGRNVGVTSANFNT